MLHQCVQHVGGLWGMGRETTGPSGISGEVSEVTGTCRKEDPFGLHVVQATYSGPGSQWKKNLLEPAWRLVRENSSGAGGGTLFADSCLFMRHYEKQEGSMARNR